MPDALGGSLDGDTMTMPALGEVKAYLRVDGVGEDATIGALAGAAAAVCETFGGATLIAREFTDAVEAGGAWTRLRRTPVREIAGVTDAGGEALPVDAYATDIDANADGWVRVSAGFSGEPVRVRYRAGLAESWGGLPAPLKHGVVRLAAHFYVHRDGDAAPPAAVTALWRPYRRMPFGRAHDEPFGRAHDGPFGRAHDRRLR